MRTKFPKQRKSKRTRYPAGVKGSNVQAGSVRNMGGFLINPSIKCPHRRQAADCKYTTWTDLGMCINCDINCIIYQRFSKMNAVKREQYLINNGVRKIGNV